jgi:uncharacterized membrane protein
MGGSAAAENLALPIAGTALQFVGIVLLVVGVVSVAVNRTRDPYFSSALPNRLQMPAPDSSPDQF